MTGGVDWRWRRPSGYRAVTVAHAYLPGAEETVCGLFGGEVRDPADADDPHCLDCTALLADAAR